MKVRALMTGYFDHLRRREGDVFVIPDEPRRNKYPSESQEAFEDAAASDGKVPQAFSTRWMERVSNSVPEKTSTAQEAVNKMSNEIKAGKQKSSASSHVI